MNPYEPPQLDPASSEVSSIASCDVVVVEINYTPEFVIDSSRRLRSLTISGGLLCTSMYVAFVDCVLNSLLAIFGGRIPLGTFWAAFAAYWALSGAFNQWWTKRNLLRSPFINEKVQLEFSNAGLRATSTSQDTKLTWDVFTKVVRFDDGFLLLQGPGLCTWIPFHAILSEKGLDQLTQLFVSKIGSSEDRRTHRVT